MKHGTRSNYRCGCRCDDCREANTQWYRDYAERNRRESGQRRWPLSPLVAVVGGDTDVEIAARLGTDRVAIARWRARGIPEYTADKLAVRHGVHPSHIWPDWFDRALADEDVAA